MQPEPTPRPWEWDVRDEWRPQGTWHVSKLRSSVDYYEKAIVPTKRTVLSHESWYVHPSEADRDLIVEAVNNYDRLRAIEAAARDILRNGSTYHDVGSIHERLRLGLGDDHAA